MRGMERGVYPAHRGLLYPGDGLRGRPRLRLLALASGEHLLDIILLLVALPSTLVSEEPELGRVAQEGGGDPAVPLALRHEPKFVLQAADLLQGLISEGPSRLGLLSLMRYAYP